MGETVSCCEHCMKPKVVEDNFKAIEKYAKELSESLETVLHGILVRLDRLDGEGGE
jgi:hypothetical protein